MDAEASVADDGSNSPEIFGAAAATEAPGIPAEAGALNGDTQAYQRHALGNGVSLAIPKSWYILPRQEVAAVRATADQVYHGGDSSKETPFAANSSQDSHSHEAQARVSFVSKEFEEAELRAASAADLNGVCNELYNGWTQNPSSPRLIGRPQCSVTNLNGRSALLTRYTRGGSMPGTTWTVSMMQIPLESKMAMITLSQMDGSATAHQVIANIIASVRFD